jgi:hypothetical protein
MHRGQNPGPAKTLNNPSASVLIGLALIGLIPLLISEAIFLATIICSTMFYIRSEYLSVLTVAVGGIGIFVGFYILQILLINAGKRRGSTVMPVYYPAAIVCAFIPAFFIALFSQSFDKEALPRMWQRQFGQIIIRPVLETIVDEYTCNKMLSEFPSSFSDEIVIRGYKVNVSFTSKEGFIVLEPRSLWSTPYVFQDGDGTFTFDKIVAPEHPNKLVGESVVLGKQYHVDWPNRVTLSYPLIFSRAKMQLEVGASLRRFSHDES